MLFEITLFLVSGRADETMIRAYCYADDLDRAQAKALKLFLSGYAPEGYMLQSARVEPYEKNDATVVLTTATSN